MREREMVKAFAFEGGVFHWGFGLGFFFDVGLGFIFQFF